MLWYYHLSCTKIVGGGETLEEELKKRNHRSSREDLAILEQYLAGIDCTVMSVVVSLLKKTFYEY
jgi:hypothetical protein